MFTRQTMARLTIVCVSLIAVSLMFVCTTDAEVENLVRNGDFERDTDLNQWSFEISAAKVKIDKKTSATGSSSLFVEIDHVLPDKPWEPQVKQLGYTFKKGKTYTLSAWLKAEKTCMLQMYIGLDKAPWTEYFKKTVIVETEWKEFWTTGTMSADVSPGRITPARNNSDSPSDINFWVDDVRFYEGEYEPTVYNPNQAVTPIGKLSTTWAMVKAQY